MRFMLRLLLLMLFVSCSQSGGNGGGSNNSTLAYKKINSIALDSNSTLFRTSVSNGFSLTVSEATKLMKTTSLGEIKEQEFGNDAEKISSVEVQNVRRLSDRFMVIRIKTNKIIRMAIDDSSLMKDVETYTTSDGIVDSTTGDIYGIDGFFYDIDNLVEHKGYLFGFDSSLKTLQRVKLDSGEVVKYLTLSGNETFMVGNRFGVSNVSVWWDDLGNTPSKSPNFVPILVDVNLNVLAQINSGSGTYPKRVILPDGASSSDITNLSSIDVGGNGSEPNSGVLLTYASDGKLLRLHSNSGFYTHLWGSSPAPSAVDITVSSISFSQAGIQATQLSQMNPFSGLTFNSDNKPLRTRNNESVSSNIRSIAFDRGVLEIDLSNSSSPQVSYTDFNAHLFGVIGSEASAIKSVSLKDTTLYFLNAGSTSILKIDLNNHNTTTSVILTDTNITSFYVVGSNIIYTTGSETYSFNLTSSTKNLLHNSQGMIADIISI